MFFFLNFTFLEILIQAYLITTNCTFYLSLILIFCLLISVYSYYPNYSSSSYCLVSDNYLYQYAFLSYEK